MCGTGIVTKAVRPETKVIGVQAEGAAAVARSWQTGTRQTTEKADTWAEGMATRQTYELTFDALCRGLTDFVLVTDAELAEAMRLLWRTTHNMVEPAGAGSIAALGKLADRLQGKTVAVILTGANADADTIRRVLDHEL